MNSRSIIPQLFAFIIYLFLQIVFARNVVIFNTAFCYVYLAFLLLLPFDTNKLLLLFLGFVTGFILDVFYDSLGIHTAACVLVMYLRPLWINLITPRGEEDEETPSVKNMGFQWFATYAIPLIFTHHIGLFYIEAGGLHLFFFTFFKVFFSTILTFITVVIIQYLFYSSKRATSI